MSITKACRISWKEFTVSDFEIALLDKLSPIIWGGKFTLPIPTLCPEERARQRMLWKNYFYLWKGKCDKTGASIISTFWPKNGYTVYNQASWWNCEWNAMDYGIDIDLSKSISEQFHTILKSAPQMSLDNAYKELENSEYINGNGWSKDCYLISNGNNNERCLYAWTIFYATNVLSSNYVTSSENCSYSDHIWKCYNVHFAFDANECRDSRYIFSCKWSHSLLGCVNLENSSYQILNTPCTKEEYETTLSKLQHNESFCKDFENKFLALGEKIWVQKNITTWSESSTGDFYYDSKNSLECYGVSNLENCAYLYDIISAKDSMDINQWWDNISLSYQAIAVGRNISNIYFSASIWENAQYNFYSFQCQACSYIFGCYGLENKSYCIFNKQYSKDIWEEKVKGIIHSMQITGEWWEFFNPRFALYPYDASYAMDRFPITKDEALKQWFTWSDYESKPEWITKTIPAKKLPFDIREIPDDVLNWAILCEKTGKPYKIQKIELDMYRKFGIPIPHLHPLERIQRFFEWDRRKFTFDF